MLDLQLLRYFVSVAETESIARAAERLHISSSPLSRRIMALETRLGQVLFERTRQRLQLTPAGSEFLREARALLASAASLERRTRDAALGQGRMTIGFVESAAHAGVLRQTVQAVCRDSPLARLTLRKLRSPEQFRALQDGEIDIGLTHSAPHADSGLRSLCRVDEAFMLAVPARHPLIRRANRARAPRALSLDGQDFVAIARSVSPAGRTEFDEACTRAGFEPRVVVEAADPGSALAAAQAGAGIAVLQASLAFGAPDGVHFLPMPADFAPRLRVYELRRSPARRAA